MLIFGKQSTNEVTPVLVDSSGRIIISPVNPSIFNPSGILTHFLNSNIAAGFTTQTFYTIPTSQRHIIYHLDIRYAGTVAGVTLYPFIGDGVGISYIDAIITPVNGKFYSFNLQIVCEAGWSIGCQVGGGTAGDDLDGSVITARIL